LLPTNFPWRVHAGGLQAPAAIRSAGCLDAWLTSQQGRLRQPLAASRNADQNPTPPPPPQLRDPKAEAELAALRKEKREARRARQQEQAAIWGEDDE
jgi:hypothetical protein